MSEASIPSTPSAWPSPMKAWVYHEHGEPRSVLQLEDAPIPVPTYSSVLVKVKCAALNPVGWKSMKTFPSIMVKKPAIAEMDVSGVVVSVGERVSTFKPGEEVYGIIPAEVEMKTGRGALAEYALVEEGQLVHKPAHISWQEAAATPLAALTAYESLVTIGGLRAGQRAFINGGSGGVGTFGVQIARAIGASVVATCSTPNTALVQSLGAEMAVDYKAGDVATQLRQHFSPPDKRFDVILDAIGDPMLFRQCDPFLSPQGIYVQAGAPISDLMSTIQVGASALRNMILPSFLGGSSRRFKMMMMHSTKEQLEAVNGMLQAGTVKPVIDSVYAFADVHSAYDKIMSSRARGKVVVNVENQ